MKIEDVEVGMEVKLVSTLFTDVELGYIKSTMLPVGAISEVIYVDDEDVEQITSKNRMLIAYCNVKSGSSRILAVWPGQ